MADYKGVLTDLRARRVAIEKERVDLDTAIAAVERLASSTVNSTAGQGTQETRGIGVSSRAFVGVTMPQAITKYFALVNEPQTTRQVLDGLKAGGVKATSGLRGHVYNTLHRLSQDNGPFRHETDGRWSLREWNATESAHFENQNAPSGMAH